MIATVALQMINFHALIENLFLEIYFLIHIVHAYIKNKMSSSNVITNGLAIRGATAREESSRITVENWLKGLGY